jgi:hypothetical protein
MDAGTVAGTLFILFIVLKLTGNIAWSWWWVLSPLWIDAAATLLLIGVLAMFGITVGSVYRYIRKQVF